jgi:hypothetical protein
MMRATMPTRLAALGALVVSGCAARAAVRAEIDIAAPPAVVWDVLSDLSAYPAWNPFTTQVDGTFAQGADVMLHVQLVPGKKQKLQRQRIVVIEPGARLDWETKLGHPALLRARRTQQLTPLPQGGTHYATTDAFSGALVTLVMGLYRRDMEMGFAKMAQALKARAEALARERATRSGSRPPALGTDG